MIANFIKKIFIITLPIFFGLNNASYGQTVRLSYLEHLVISDQLDGDNLAGGLSGITYNKSTDNFYSCADKPPSRIVQFSCSEDRLNITPIGELLLKPDLMAKSELEGIAYDQKSNGFYVSDEQGNGTRILQLDSSGRFVKVILPNNSTFLPLSAHNSGIEGLTLSGDNKTLFIAFERPSNSCFDKQVTTIGSINLENGHVKLYAYQLHTVTDDKLNTNGISEILWLDDNTLLVMERAYLPGQGNIVRLYETVLVNPISFSSSALECTDEQFQPLESKLIFDFADAEGIKVDNAEGMTLNKDKSKLYIVTDNNFSSRQETQLISLEVKWLDKKKRPE